LYKGFCFVFLFEEEEEEVNNEIIEPFSSKNAQAFKYKSLHIKPYNTPPQIKKTLKQLDVIYLFRSCGRQSFLKL